MIHSLLLACALLPQGGPSHSALHPAHADAFFEVGDVTQLLVALDTAPVVRLVRDARWKGILDKTGWSPEPALPELVGKTLETYLPSAAAPKWLPGLKTVSASVTVVDPAPAEGDPLALLVLAELATSEQASALFAAILANAPKHEACPGALEGAQRLHLKEKAYEDLWCAAVGTRVVLGSQLSKPEDYRARAEHQLAGLDKSETFAKELARLEPASGTPVLWFALGRSINEIVKATNKPGEATTGPMQALERIPADWNPLGSARVARMSFSGERFLTDLVTAEASSGAARAVDPSWLEPVPSGQMLVYASPFEGGDMGRLLRAYLTTDEAGTARLTALEGKLGFGPEKVLSHLGPGMTVYLAPLSGAGLPQSYAWIDCDDATAFTKEFDALVGALGETLPGYEAQTKPYKVRVKGSEEKVEVPVTTLKLPADLIPIPMISVSPSFAPVGKKLVFALNSMDLKNELKRAVGGDGEPIIAGAKPLAAYGVELPPEVLSVLVMDWGRMLSSLLETFKAFGQMVPPEQMPVDLRKLPKGDIFTEYLKPTLHYAKGGTDGMRRRNEASFGPETWFGIAAAIAGFAQHQTHRPPEGAAPGTGTDPKGSGGR